MKWGIEWVGQCDMCAYVDLLTTLPGQFGAARTDLADLRVSIACPIADCQTGRVYEVREPSQEILCAAYLLGGRPAVEALLPESRRRDIIRLK